MTNREVSLFIPCLVDQMYPNVGKATVGVLEALGYAVKYSPAITCCGQPAFNSGEWDKAREVARGAIHEWDKEGEIPIVCPSGSCTAMVRNFYGELFADGEEHTHACMAGKRIRELSEFLIQDGKAELISGTWNKKVGFHHSCHAVRELHVKEAPLTLLERFAGVEIVAGRDEPVCCGFGGLFCVKFDAIGQGIARSRFDYFVGKGAEVVVSNDTGCLLHMTASAEKAHAPVKFLHLAEALAEGMGVRYV